MSNKPKRQYSLGERVTLAGLFLALAGIFVLLAFGLLQLTWQSLLLDQRFEREGVQTQGFVSGFRHVTFTGKFRNRDSGQYPIVTIDTPKGTFQIPTSYAHPLNKAQQDKLLWEKVDVVYLRSEPSVGRVVKWHSSSGWGWVLMGLGVFILAVGLFVLYMAWRMLTDKNE